MKSHIPNEELLVAAAVRELALAFRNDDFTQARPGIRKAVLAELPPEPQPGTPAHAAWTSAFNEAEAAAAADWRRGRSMLTRYVPEALRDLEAVAEAIRRVRETG